MDFSTKVNTVFADINEWFMSNLLSLDFNKNYFLQFRTKNSQKIDLNITLLNKHITNTTDIKLVGLTIDETLSWKCHINHILSRLCTVCYAIRPVTPLMAEKTLRIIYFSYAHSIMYGMILGWNAPHSNNIFKIQKGIIRIITKSKHEDSCRQLFRKL